MKKLLLIALMFCFFIGNAQQEKSHYGQKNTGSQAQLYYGINPGYPSLLDLNTNKIRKTDAHPGYPVTIDPYTNEIAKPDFENPGYTFESCPYLDEIRITDSQEGNISSYPYLKKKMKTD